MQPLLHQGKTRVVIVPISGTLQPGDLPLYRRPSGQFVLHRIIKGDGQFYYTRGDNRTGLEPVPHEWVLGVVTEIHRNGKIIPVTAPAYRCYVTLWNAFYPLRYPWCRLRYLYQKLKRGRL